MSAPRPWLIVGTTTRAVAQAAARHGHRVCAIDAFADREVLEACEGRVVRLDVDADWRITPAALDRALEACRREHAPQGFAGLVAGSGLDSAFALRARLAREAPLAGCDEATLRVLRQPEAWFALLDALRIAHPPVCHSLGDGARAGPGSWLRKSADGSGGWHVQAWEAGSALQPGEYLQWQVPGRPASALFVADKRSLRVVGWQWQRLSPCPALPWRYGGIVSAPDMPACVRDQVNDGLERLAARLPLSGVGSLDFILATDGVHVLEINPRPSASVALYPECDLFAWHTDTAGTATATPASSPEVRGEAVLFADQPLRVAADFAWPDHCVDLPAHAAHFDPGDPVCTVQIRGTRVADVQAGLDARLRLLTAALESASDAHGWTAHTPLSHTSKETPDEHDSDRHRLAQCQPTCPEPG